MGDAVGGELVPGRVHRVSSSPKRRAKVADELARLKEANRVAMDELTRERAARSALQRADELEAVVGLGRARPVVPPAVMVRVAGSVMEEIRWAVSMLCVEEVDWGSAPSGAAVTMLWYAQGSQETADKLLRAYMSMADRSGGGGASDGPEQSAGSGGRRGRGTGEPVVGLIGRLLTTLGAGGDAGGEPAE